MLATWSLPDARAHCNRKLQTKQSTCQGRTTAGEFFIFCINSFLPAARPALATEERFLSSLKLSFEFGCGQFAMSQFIATRDHLRRFPLIFIEQSQAQRDSMVL